MNEVPSLFNGIIRAKIRKRKRSLIENLHPHFKAISKRQIHIYNSKDFSVLKYLVNKRMIIFK